MSLNDYLHHYGDHRQITLVGPMLAAPPCPNPPAEPLIWVDGGAHHRRARANNSGFSIGDGDSFDGKLDQLLDTDKDYSDLAYVLRRLPRHFTEVVLLGFLGARRDHELFNLGEVHHFLTAATAPTRVRFDERVTGYSAGLWTFDIDGLFSLAVFAHATVQLTGACQYPITPPTEIAPLTSLGLSNRGFGEVALSLRAPAFIFYNDAST